MFFVVPPTRIRPTLKRIPKNKKKRTAMKYDYVILDVFTRDKLAGNPLAVVMKAEGLSDVQMQAVATEFNLSETVFVRQPRLDNHSAELRIFTPKKELPFAGHPTVGVAVYLALRQRLQGVRLEEKLGVVTCVMEVMDRSRASAHFSLPRLPEKTGDAPSAEVLAQVLSLDSSEIGFGPFAPDVYSAGNEFVLVPVASADALKRIRLQRRGWSERLGGEDKSLYVFAPTPEEAGFDYAARMFAPDMGIGEDPATGSAAGALIGLLAAHEPLENGKVTKALRQGYEMGRPSKISMRYTMTEGRLTRAGIGGDAVLVAQGVLDLTP